MTPPAAEPIPNDDDDFDYGFGNPDIDAWVRRRAATWRDLTPVQVAKLNDLFNPVTTR